MVIIILLMLLNIQEKSTEVDNLHKDILNEFSLLNENRRFTEWWGFDYKKPLESSLKGDTIKKQFLMF